MPRGISLANIYLSDTNASNPAVIYFDGITNTLNKTIAIPAANALGLAFSPDARRLYVATADDAGANDIVVLDTVPGSSTYQQVIANITLNATEGFTNFTRADYVFVNPRGDYAFFLQRGNTTGVGLIDLRPDSSTLNQLVASVEGLSGDPIDQAAFTPDGKQLWWPETSTEGSKIAIINTNATDPAFRQVSELDLGMGVNATGIAINGDGSKAFVADSISNGLLVFNVSTQQQIGTVTGGNGSLPLGPVVATQSGQVFVPTANQTIVRVYDGNADAFLGEIDLGVDDVEDRFLALSPAQDEAYLSGGLSQTLRVINTSQLSPTFVTNITTVQGDSAARPVILAVQGGPQSVVATLATEITTLAQKNVLTQQEATVLLQNLSTVSTSLAQGNVQGALNALDAFNSEVVFLTQIGTVNGAVGTQIGETVTYLLSQL